MDKKDVSLPPLSGKVVWLIPDMPEQQRYSEIIGALSDKFGTPLFSPHITLGSLPDRPVSALSQMLDSVLTKISPIELTPEFIRCSSNPYQNLVHQLKMSPVMKTLGDELAQILPGFKPKKEIHISLLYGQVDCDEIEEYRNEIEKLLPDKVHVSGYKIIGLSGNVGGWSTLHYQTMENV